MEPSVDSLSVTVVTPATGHPGMRRCLRSVQEQSHPSVEHLIVVDGPPRVAGVTAALEAFSCGSVPVQLMHLPQQTGGDGYNGHRIYGAASFLVNSDFICFLDEDNWFDSDHIASLVAAVTASDAAWGFSLRKVVDQAGNFIALDRCDSLGNLHPVFYDCDIHLVDTSCYIVRREVAVCFAPLWHRRRLSARGPAPADRAFCAALLRHHPSPASTRRHTVNYAVGNRSGSADASWFLTGNKAMEERYPLGLPWEREG